MRHSYMVSLSELTKEFAVVQEKRSHAYQLALFETAQIRLPLWSRVSEGAIPVSFREVVPEIEDTGYLTHGLFYYPAKFIPHVPYFCIREFCPEEGWVADPFAGSGTVGLEAVLARRNAILIDINPMLSHMVELKINFRRTDISEMRLLERAKEMFDSKELFNPDWQNIEYWYPPEILNTLKRYWGWVHANTGDVYTQILQCSLLRASRRFSLAEHKAPKLFRSKEKLKQVDELLRTDWKSYLDQFIVEHSLDVLRRVRALAQLTVNHNCRAVAYAGVDSASIQIDDIPTIDLIVTSPPYLQAQEYIRTFKLDLFWLGYSSSVIREISRLEIPYRKAREQFHSPTLDKLRSRITRQDLRDLVNSYFYYTTKALSNVASKLRTGGHICIFVGNPKVDGVEVETWRIFAEYLEEQGHTTLGVYEDTIKNRQLFRGRRNKNPEGMSSEFLLIMQRRR